MKKILVLASIVLSSVAVAFAGGGNTDSPTIKTFAYVTCNDPQFAPHLNPNRLMISLSEVYATHTRQPISGLAFFGAPRVANGGAYVNYIKSGVNTFTGALNDQDQRQLSVKFNGNQAFVTVAEGNGRVTNFTLTCGAGKSNGGAPSRMGWDLEPATVDEALSIIQN